MIPVYFYKILSLLIRLPARGAKQWDTAMKKHSYLGLVGTLILALGVSASAVDYYINDLSTTNDVYCSEIGDDGNSGEDPVFPCLR